MHRRGVPGFWDAGVVTDKGVGLDYIDADPASGGLASDVFVFGNGVDVSQERRPLPSTSAVLGR